MVRFLTREWLDELERAAGNVTLPEDVAIVVAHEVSGTPAGDVAFVFAAGGGRITLTWDTTDDAEITLLEDYPTAVAIATGQLPAQQAVADGRLKLRGDVGALVRNAAAIEALGDMFRAVRVSTQF